MSWSTFARKVRDPSLPLGRRYRCLGSCVNGYSWLTHGSYEAIWQRILARHPALSPGSAFTGEELIAALEDLEAERRAFLARLEALRAKRQAEKRAGRRQPAREDLDALFGPGEAERRSRGR